MEILFGFVVIISISVFEKVCTCSTYGRDDKCMKNMNRKTWVKEATLVN